MTGKDLFSGDWREVHEKFFAECLNEAGLKFTSDMKVVCEEFSVVYK